MSRKGNFLKFNKKMSPEEYEKLPTITTTDGKIHKSLLKASLCKRGKVYPILEIVDREMQFNTVIKCVSCGSFTYEGYAENKCVPCLKQDLIKNFKRLYPISETQYLCRLPEGRIGKDSIAAISSDKEKILSVYKNEEGFLEYKELEF